MRLYSFCVLGVMGVSIGCFGEGSNKTVIRDSCEQREVKLPDDWKAECLDDDGKLRTTLAPKKYQACVNISGNNRNLKRKGCIKPPQK